VDAELFNQYIKEIFIPTVAANRELPGCANKPAILFCDNCASHCSDEILRELARNEILVPTYTPHTSHLFQVLDVLLFGRLKAFKKYLPKDNNEDREIDHILRISRAYERIITNMMIRASWERAGFSSRQRDGTFYFAVDEGRIRVAGFLRNLGEELSHRVAIGSEEESEVEMGEPTILPREICEAIERKPNRLHNIQFIKEFDDHLRREGQILV
jgi:hypothetical protein